MVSGPPGIRPPDPLIVNQHAPANPLPYQRFSAVVAGGLQTAAAGESLRTPAVKGRPRLPVVASPPRFALSPQMPSWSPAAVICTTWICGCVDPLVVEQHLGRAEAPRERARSYSCRQ